MAADTPQIHDIISGDLATRAKQLMLFSRYRVEGRYAGENPSIRKGFSTDFLQHRQYVPGDNLKYIDWRVYGRTGRYVVREYEETTNVDCYLVLDNSASMRFADGELGKHGFAVRLCALLSYVMLLQKDAFSLSLVTDTLANHVPPATGRRHLLRIYETLLANPPGGQGSWEAAMPLVQARIRRRGLVIVISDFMADPEAISRALSAFRSLKCDVVAFHLQHPRELDLDQTSMTRFVDIEDGTAETVDPMLMRDAYREEVARHSQGLHHHLNRRGIAYCPLLLGPDFDIALGDYLRHRMNTLL